MKPDRLALVALTCLGSGSVSAFSLRAFVVSTKHQNFKSAERKSLTKSWSMLVDNDESETKKKDADPKFDFSDLLRPVVFGEKLAIPFIENAVELENGMVNSGMYSWMYPYLGLAGFKPGNTMVGAIPTSDLPVFYNEVEQEAMRQAAAESLVNISDGERSRRREMSNNFYAASAIYAAVSSILLDDGSLAGNLLRFAIVLPLTAAYGLQLSADRGLWNVAQGGLWDVAGEIEPVPDPSIANRLLEKVNQLNNEAPQLPLLGSIVWSALPHETASSVSFVGVCLALLYFLRDKVPKSA